MLEKISNIFSPMETFSENLIYNQNKNRRDTKFHVALESPTKKKSLYWFDPAQCKLFSGIRRAKRFSLRCYFPNLHAKSCANYLAEENSQNMSCFS